jgi:SAM-dependent methyltransferase
MPPLRLCFSTASCGVNERFRRRCEVPVAASSILEPMEVLDRALGPLVRLLDPRPSDVAQAHPLGNSVNIPLNELAGRTHELPPRFATIQVAGADASGAEAVAWLQAHGRQAELVAEWESGFTPNGRLWSPNEFLVECVADLPMGRALDLGCGTGRDAVALAALGWEVTAVDRLPEAVDKGRDLARRYAAERAGSIRWLVADLEQADWPLWEGFDLAMAFFWLHKPSISRPAGLLKPGGSLLIEAFSETHRRRRGKPGPERVADPAELAEMLAPLNVVCCEERERGDRHTVCAWAIRQT